MFNKVAQNISGGKMEKGTREQNIEVGPSGSHTARNEGLRPTLRGLCPRGVDQAVLTDPVLVTPTFLCCGGRDSQWIR